MDTFIQCTAYGEQAPNALERVQQRLEELESLWSVTDEASEIYAINHSAGQPIVLSDETSKAVSFALEMAEQTGGALEPTIYPVLTAWGFTTEEKRVPSGEELERLLRLVGYGQVKLDKNRLQIPEGVQLDLGAVGKGFASDEAVHLLKESGVSSALLDIGGNIHAIGAKPDGSDWRLGLKNPDGDGNLGVLSVSDRAVVTSGSYERFFIGEDGKRYGHILDPVTGRPAESGLLSVTVIADEGKMCDALSTSLFVMGLERAAEFWRQNQSFEMILITEDGEIHLTEGIHSRFALSPAHIGRTITVI